MQHKRTSLCALLKGYRHIFQCTREERTTRSGDLVFWERVVTGATSGTDQDLVVPVADSIEQLLKQFFADYLNAQR